MGQRVQAKFLPNSTKWSHATIHHVCGSTLQVPIRRVRRATNNRANDRAGATNDRCAAMSPLTPPPPRSPSSLPDVDELQRLKRAAVMREDFLAAAQIKIRIANVEKIALLEQRKQKAVCDEDFLLAMDLKKQIASALESAICALTPPK